MRRVYQMRIAGIVLLIAAALVIGYAVVSRKAFHNDAVLWNAANLVSLVSDWRKAGAPQGEALTNLLSGYGSFRPFAFTNTMKVNGTNYQCLFAVRSPRFAEDGLLAVTKDQVAIWVGQKERRIVEVTQHP